MARPTKFDNRFCKQAYKLCLLGATDKELADFFEVTEQTLNNWKKDYPDFFESLKKGKDIADSNVSERLYKRAMGYKHKDLYITQYQGEIIKEEIIKYYPPDTTACIFWLKNRQSANWSDKQEFKHSVDPQLPFTVEITRRKRAGKVQAQ